MMPERTQWIKRIRELKEQKEAQKRIIDQLRKENAELRETLEPIGHERS